MTSLSSNIIRVMPHDDWLILNLPQCQAGPAPGLPGQAVKLHSLGFTGPPGGRRAPGANADAARLGWSNSKTRTAGPGRTQADSEFRNLNFLEGVQHFGFSDGSVSGNTKKHQPFKGVSPNAPNSIMRFLSSCNAVTIHFHGMIRSLSRAA